MRLIEWNLSCSEWIIFREKNWFSFVLIYIQLKKINWIDKAKIILSAPTFTQLWWVNQNIFLLINFKDRYICQRVSWTAGTSTFRYPSPNTSEIREKRKSFEIKKKRLKIMKVCLLSRLYSLSVFCLLFKCENNEWNLCIKRSRIHTHSSFSGKKNCESNEKKNWARTVHEFNPHMTSLFMLVLWWKLKICNRHTKWQGQLVVVYQNQVVNKQKEFSFLLHLFICLNVHFVSSEFKSEHVNEWWWWWWW